MAKFFYDGVWKFTMDQKMYVLQVSGRNFCCNEMLNKVQVLSIIIALYLFTCNVFLIKLTFVKLYLEKGLYPV